MNSWILHCNLLTLYPDNTHTYMYTHRFISPPFTVQRYGAVPHQNLTCVACSADTDVEIAQHERRGPLDQLDP